jgi:hypothetical protein
MIVTKSHEKEIENQLANIVKDWDELTAQNKSAWVQNAIDAIQVTGHFEVSGHKNIFGQLRYIEVGV